MKLYKGYCYPDLETVRQQILSEPFLGDGSIITHISDYNPYLSIYTDTRRIVLIKPPDCTSIGDSKISFSDSGELAWLVAAVLIGAFSIKVLKRGL